MSPSDPSSNGAGEWSEIFDIFEDGPFKRRFEARGVDQSKVRPVSFAWRPWLPRGRLCLEVGEENIGKSTFQAFIAAQLTTGGLPGVFEGKPADVLFVGADEDDWYEVVVPRLIAAGADLDRVHEFYARDEAAVFNVEDHAADFDRVLGKHDYALVVFEHLMDVLPRMRSYTDPAAMRGALKPLRRVLARREVAGLGTLHVNKAAARSFRERQQGSMQFGAVSRSSFLIDRHPSDRERRIAVLGKANYVSGPVAVAFAIESRTFLLNGEPFDVGRVVDVVPDASTMEDVLRPSSLDRDRARDDLRDDVLDVLRQGVPGANSLGTGTLAPPPMSGHAVAQALGRSKTDGTVRRVLADLEAGGEIQKVSGGWTLVEHPPEPTLRQPPEPAQSAIFDYEPEDDGGAS